MIDAIAVVEIAVAARSRAHPGVVVARHHVRAPWRQAPVLAGFTEGIRRHADRRVKAEFVLPRPHVRTVGGDHEGQIAEHSRRPRQPFGLRPLLRRDPLQVRPVGDLLSHDAARFGDRCGVRPRERLWPLRPRGRFMQRADRPKQRVLVQPPRLRGDKCVESRRARRAPRHLEPEEALERASQPAILQAANRRVLDARRLLQPLDLRLLGAVERVLRAQCPRSRRRSTS